VVQRDLPELKQKLHAIAEEPIPRGKNDWFQRKGEPHLVLPDGSCTWLGFMQSYIMNSFNGAPLLRFRLKALAICWFWVATSWNNLSHINTLLLRLAGFGTALLQFHNSLCCILVPHLRRRLQHDSAYPRRVRYFYKACKLDLQIL
jgi:hypothetical protein